MTYEELTAVEPPLRTLIPIEEFKSILGIDDRDDKLVKFCLATATITIENYCKRKLLHKQHFEKIEYTGDLVMPLREYPVTEVLAVSLFDTSPSMAGEILEPDLYCVIPDCGTDNDIPFDISFSPAVERLRFTAIKVNYYAGYEKDKVPADLAAACLELASWNFNRYKSKRIGMTGNIKGAGIQGEHFELSLPENVQLLLEPYKRRVI
jgi:uncharacterized phiE125 gp8 family phage protein